MTRLADVLAWKFDFAPGIRTREGPDGKMVIFDWPKKALGPQPTSDQITQWTADFEALPADQVDLDTADLWAILKAKGTVADVDLPADRRIPPRR